MFIGQSQLNKAKISNNVRESYLTLLCTRKPLTMSSHQHCCLQRTDICHYLLSSLPLLSADCDYFCSLEQPWLSHWMLPHMSRCSSSMRWLVLEDPWQYSEKLHWSQWKRFGSLGFQPPQEIEGGVPLLCQVDLNFLQNNQSRVLWQVSENLRVRGVGKGRGRR